MTFETLMKQNRIIKGFCGYVNSAGRFIFDSTRFQIFKVGIETVAVQVFEVLFNAYNSGRIDGYCSIPEECIVDLSEIAPVYACLKPKEDVIITVFEDGNITKTIKCLKKWPLAKEV